MRKFKILTYAYICISIVYRLIHFHTKRRKILHQQIGNYKGINTTSQPTHMCFEDVPFVRSFYNALSALDISWYLKNTSSLNICLEQIILKLQLCRIVVVSVVLFRSSFICVVNFVNDPALSIISIQLFEEPLLIQMHKFQPVEGAQKPKLLTWGSVCVCMCAHAK